MAETKKTTATKTVAKKTTTAKTTTKKTTATKVEEVKTPETVSAPVEVKAPVKKEKKAGPSLKVTLVKSAAGRLVKQQRTLVALGLNKINAVVIKPDNAAVRGMLFVVKHLVKVEEVK